MPQKFYTGDENGLVKVVIVPDAPAPEKQIKSIRNVERAPKDGKQQKKEEEAQGTTVEVWGQPDRNRAIQLMTWDHDRKHLVVARKNGLVQLLNPQDGSITLEVQQTMPPKQGKIEPAFVGLFANTKNLITCTNAGVLTMYAIESPTTSQTVNLGQNLCRMRVHPHDHHLVATCGNEEELTIWDLHQIFPEESSTTTTTTTTTAGAHDEKKNTSRHKTKDNLSKGQVFKAKNVKNDFLDLRVPVWNTDFQFLDSKDHHHHRLAVGTRNHQLRVYDTKQARRPVVDVEIGTMPVVALANGKDATEVVFSDTVTNVFSVDTLTGSIIGQYKGFAGVTTALACYTPNDDSNKTNLVTVSMDRHLRVHDMTGARKLLHQVYLKQRMTAVVVGEYVPDKKSKKRGNKGDDEDDEGADADGNENDDDDDEDVWEQMGKLEEKTTKSKKSRPSSSSTKTKVATKKRKTQ
ncbi:WD repeat-containing protein 74 [Actinomortierella ambigua]|uniref:Ribosome biogenesis protein NSA1 n=1 Tax=Actinomortierella ambigua TaxID=1343610 RepID=A0A9P6UCJ7_9FUNG|nr:WD repeat-containing protein 74 [Actinomortierella ambigua]